MSTLGSSWRGSKFNWVELGWEVRREVALSQHSKPIPFKYLSSQSPFIIVVVHLFGKYFLRIYCALGTQSISAVPSISCMQPTSHLVHSLTNKTFTSVHSFLPCLTYTHLVSFTFSNSTLFFDNSNEHSNRLRRAHQGKQEILLRWGGRWESYENFKLVSCVQMFSFYAPPDF